MEIKKYEAIIEALLFTMGDSVELEDSRPPLVMMKKLQKDYT